MSSYIASWFVKPPRSPKGPSEITVSVAESVTAGALSNTLCSEPGASDYFKGGIVAYSVASKKDILGIDTTYAEKNNFANPFTTSEMAKSVTKMLKSRFGIATTGYSLPKKQLASDSQCELDVPVPYACICLYDSYLDVDISITIEYKKYNPDSNQAVQKASAQAMFALEAYRLYTDYISKLEKQEILKQVSTPAPV